MAISSHLPKREIVSPQDPIQPAHVCSSAFVLLRAREPPLPLVQRPVSYLYYSLASCGASSGEDGLPGIVESPR